MFNSINKKCIFAIMSLLLCSCSLLFAFSLQENKSVYALNNDVIVENLDKDIAYNYINKPNNLCIVHDDELFLTDETNAIYQYKNSQLSCISSSYTDLVDMYYYDDLLVILRPGEIVAYNTTTKTFSTVYSDLINSTTYLSNPIDIICNRNALFVATTNSIVSMKLKYFDNSLANDIIYTATSYEIDSTNTPIVNVQSIAVVSTNIYVLHKTADNAAIITKYLLKQTGLEQTNNKIISLSASSNIKLLTYNDNSTTNLLVLYDNKVYPCADNSEQINLFESSTRTLIEPTIIEGYSSFTSGKVLSITDFAIYKNYLYISDGNTRCNSVQRFSLNNSTLTFDEILIASCGSDLNRLYKPNGLKYTDGYVYILDAGNNRFIIKDLTTQTTTETKDAEIKNPIALDVNNKGEIYVVTNQKLKLFGKQKQSVIDLGTNKICDIQASYKDTLYLLDKENKKLLELQNGNSFQTLLEFDDEITFTQSARIKLNANGNKLYLLADNNIYTIDLTQSTLSLDKQFSSENKIIDFVLDYKDILYCCIQTTTDKFLINQISSGVTLKSVELPNTDNVNYDRLYFDITTGNIYNCDTVNSKIEIIKTQSFFNILNDFETDYSFKENPTANGANFARIKSDCKSYKYPFYTSAKLELNKDDKVIVLKESCELNNNFTYILIANKGIKNILAYIDKQYLEYDVEEQPVGYNRIKISYIGNANAYLYYLPTGLEFEDGSQSFRYPRIAKLNEEFNILGLACGYTDGTNLGYYTIKLENDDIVYLKWVYADDANKTKSTKTLQANAVAEKNTENDKLIVYEYDELNNLYKATDIELENGQKIQVINEFDTNNKYARILFEDSKGNLLGDSVTHYFIETKFIVYNDITWLQIVGIILAIIAIILIVIAIIIVTKNIKKRKLKQIETEL